MRWRAQEGKESLAQALDEKAADAGKTAEFMF